MLDDGSLLTISLIAVAVLAFASCGGPAGDARPADSQAPPPRSWAIAIHGGAGTIPRTMDEATQQEFRRALANALTLGQVILSEGGTALDAVEQVVAAMEDDPLWNAGRGAVFTADGKHTLDAAIMDGSTGACGAVAGLETVRHPIQLARRVMERSPHVFLIEDGAESFAREQGLEIVDNAFFSTERRRQQWQDAQAKDANAPAAPNEAPATPQATGGDTGDGHGTVGAVAFDRYGNLAAATSTGGITNKRYGRVGDVPVIGAGTWAANATCAVSCTGKGEEIIRRAVAHQVSSLIALGGLSLQEAVARVIADLPPGTGGLIAVSPKGELALAFNSEGMYRGEAHSDGEFEVSIW